MYIKSQQRDDIIINIAICDKNKNYLEKTKREIYRYLCNLRIGTKIEMFLSGYEMLEKSQKYDIIILSHSLIDLDGLTVAKILRREFNRDACLIFYTNHTEIAIEAYEVETFRFILKSSTKLLNAIEDYLNLYYRKIHICVKNEIRKGFSQIKIDNIVFIEIMDKISYIHLSNNDIIKTKLSLSKLEKKISQNYFFKPHRSYIINLKYISNVKKKEIVLKNNAKIPLSRNNVKLFELSYRKFLSKNKGGICHPFDLLNVN